MALRATVPLIPHPAGARELRQLPESTLSGLVGTCRVIARLAVEACEDGMLPRRDALPLIARAGGTAYRR